MKKTKGTDAIFANLQTLRDEACGDPVTLEIPMDNQAKVQTGDDALGGKTRTNAAGEVAEKGWDHDPPAKEKVVPSGILVLLTGVLTLIFGNKETSDAWVDALRMWWRQARLGPGHVKLLVIVSDNGPKNSGRRTQFLKHMVQFADETELAIRLAYFPPCHSKYNRVVRRWSALRK